MNYFYKACHRAEGYSDPCNTDGRVSRQRVEHELNNRSVMAAQSDMLQIKETCDKKQKKRRQTAHEIN